MTISREPRLSRASTTTPRDSVHAQDGFSSQGVSLRLLRLLRGRAHELQAHEGPPRVHRSWEQPPSRRKRREPLTTEDVSLEIVMPATARMGCSYAHLLSGAHADLAPHGGREDVGKANVFVSHAWSYEFADLVNALEAAAADLAVQQVGGKALSEERIFWWVDLAVNSQHRTFARPFDWWSSVFLGAVRRIGRTVVVLSPWASPTPLTRAWCLWELHATMETRSELHVHMPHRERQSFERALGEDFASIAAAMSDVDLARSNASRASDRDAILAAVRARLGLHELNVQVSAAIREWLLAAGASALSRAEAEDVARHGPLKRPLVLRNQLAVLSREHGDWASAERLFAEELWACEAAARGDDSDDDWLLALNNLAAILVRRGKYDEAEPLLEQALACRESAHGPAHEGTLVVVGNLASLLRYKGELRRAERLAHRAYRGRAHELGEKHVNTAVAASNLALCKLDRAEHAEAQRLGRHALAGARAAVGMRHLTSLSLQAHLALILASAPGEEHLDEAERMSVDALGALEQQAGRSHVDTLLARATYGMARAQRAGLIAARDRAAGIADMQGALDALCAAPHELPSNHWWIRRLRRALEHAEHDAGGSAGGAAGGSADAGSDAECTGSLLDFPINLSTE